MYPVFRDRFKSQTSWKLKVCTAFQNKNWKLSFFYNWSLFYRNPLLFTLPYLALNLPGSELDSGSERNRSKFKHLHLMKLMKLLFANFAVKGISINIKIKMTELHNEMKFCYTFHHEESFAG